MHINKNTLYYSLNNMNCGDADQEPLCLISQRYLTTPPIVKL